MSKEQTVMPKFWMELDDESIPRAITALAEEMGLDAVAEEHAHYLVGIVLANLDAGRHRQRVAAGRPVPIVPDALKAYRRDELAGLPAREGA